jgi:hypothetical protein
MRKKLYYTVKDEGRDQGKTYLLTEMPASQAEMWAARAFLAMANNGIELPAELPDAGMAGLAHIGLSLLGKLPFAEAAPLMAEMFACVQFVPDGNRPDFSRPLVENDIEEIKTRLKIRVVLLKLHSDFFSAVAPSTSASAAPQSAE